MEDDALIDISKPLIVIQIHDEKHLMLSTNINDPDDVQLILEEVLENLMEREYDAFQEATKSIRRLQ